MGLPPGKEILEAVAEVTGGIERTDVGTVLDDPPRAASRMALLPFLAIAGILLLIVEIAGRRLSLWERAPKEETAETAAVPQKRAGWLPQWKLKLPRLKKRRAKTVETTVAASEKAPAAPAGPSAKPAPEKKSEDVFAAAKRRAKRRLK
jgi:hypothetical protein